MLEASGSGQNKSFTSDIDRLIYIVDVALFGSLFDEALWLELESHQQLIEPVDVYEDRALASVMEHPVVQRVGGIEAIAQAYLAKQEGTEQFSAPAKRVLEKYIASPKPENSQS